MKIYSLIILFTFVVPPAFAQKISLNAFNKFICTGALTYIDLDQDGDADVMRTFINDSIPIQWIDDDDDMKQGDLQGDTDNDCLMIDRNRDGKYGDELDLIIDWIDNNGDSKADMQIVADNARRIDRGWTPGHFMICIDSDNDGVFNNINFNTLQLEAWAHEGRSNFYQDYSGRAMFLKIHTSSFNVEDLRYNWENPFLFYDEDGDGLSEMAIRQVDQYLVRPREKYPVSLSKHITDVRMSFDLDNDNSAGNEFDFDMSLKFVGEGFDYSKYVHRFNNMRGLPASDTFFYDSRWRQMTELIYVDHTAAYKVALGQGKWQASWFVFDEDDDCERWERAEFYDPKDLFKVGAKNGGLDNNPQADVAGDRGEWDMDFSGNGNLYISKMDGKIHLYGAEWGAWRIDEGAKYYQGWQGWRNGADTIVHNMTHPEPTTFPTIKYSDTDGNGFFDKLEFDLDGDQKFERTISLKALGINDKESIVNIRSLNYKGYKKLFQKAADLQWRNALDALKVAVKQGIFTDYYAYFMHPKSLQEKYNNGYWLAFFIYDDLRKSGERNKDGRFLIQLDKAYFSGDWKAISANKN